MLKIRRAQQDAFRDRSLVGFEDETLKVIRRHLPRSAQRFGEAELRVLIQQAVAQGESLGYEHKPDVAQLVLLMLYFGRHFLEDPLLQGWTAELREHDDYEMDGRQRLDLFYERSMGWLDEVAGPKDEHKQGAVRRLLEQCGRPASGVPAEVRIAALYPSRFAKLDAEQAEAFPPRALAEAQSLGLGATEATLYAGCMLVFGSGFVRDPLHRWAGDVLGGAPAPGRPLAFTQACMGFLGHWLAPHAQASSPGAER